MMQRTACITLRVPLRRICLTAPNRAARLCSLNATGLGAKLEASRQTKSAPRSSARCGPLRQVPGRRSELVTRHTSLVTGGSLPRQSSFADAGRLGHNARFAMERAFAIFLTIACPLLGGCAAGRGAKDATDPLYTRLLIRESRSWQALSQNQATPPALAPSAGGSDIPYVGPPIEPPLPEPDFGLIPEDVPFEPPLP